MDKRFQNLKDRSERIIAESVRRNKKIALATLLDAWQELERQGVEAYDFARVAVLVAEGAMVSYDRLEEVEKFGEHLKSRGSSIIRSVRDHWPPVDPKDWPDEWPNGALKGDGNA